MLCTEKFYTGEVREVLQMNRRAWCFTLVAHSNFVYILKDCVEEGDGKSCSETSYEVAQRVAPMCTRIALGRRPKEVLRMDPEMKVVIALGFLASWGSLIPRVVWNEDAMKICKGIPASIFPPHLHPWILAGTASNNGVVVLLNRIRRVLWSIALRSPVLAWEQVSLVDLEI